MRTLILGLAAAIAIPAAAFADDLMNICYGNTLIGKSSRGELHSHYKPDHTFDAVGSNWLGSRDFKGTWTLDAKNQLCRIYDEPPPGQTNPVCIDWAAHKVGDSWTVNDATLTLVQGIQ